jgi:hypothetical protein
MSRDATGFYSGWAKELVPCPVCGADKTKGCDLSVEGYSEHGVHWDRTESVPVGLTEETAKKAWDSESDTAETEDKAGAI